MPEVASDTGAHLTFQLQSPSSLFRLGCGHHLAQFGETGKRLINAVQQAFVDGISGAVLTAAIVLVLATIAVALRAPRPTSDQPTQEPRTANAP